MNKRVQRASVLGIITNVVLSLIKLIFGVSGRSNSMIADGVNSSLDIINSISVYIGLKIACLPPDKNHPYGHYKAEILSTLLIAVMISTGGIKIVWNNLENLFYGNYEKVEIGVLYAAAISILLKIGIYLYTNHVANEEDSISLRANAIDYKSDILLSIGVFIGVIASVCGYEKVDSFIAAMVGLFMLRVSYNLVAEASSQIMDERVDKSVIDEVKRIASGVQGVLNVHFVRVRKGGALYFVDMDIVVHSELSLKEAHVICHDVLNAVRNNVERIAEVRIHLDPYDDGDCR